MNSVAVNAVSEVVEDFLGVKVCGLFTLHSERLSRLWESASLAPRFVASSLRCLVLNDKDVNYFNK